MALDKLLKEAPTRQETKAMWCYRSKCLRLAGWPRQRIDQMPCGLLLSMLTSQVTLVSLFIMVYHCNNLQWGKKVFHSLSESVSLPIESDALALSSFSCHCSWWMGSHKMGLCGVVGTHAIEHDCTMWHGKVHYKCDIWRHVYHHLFPLWLIKAPVCLQRFFPIFQMELNSCIYDGASLSAFSHHSVRSPHLLHSKM